jgi:hypothetical protein
VTGEQLQEPLQQRLLDEGAPLVLNNIDEVTEVPCGDMTRSFESVLDFKFYAQSDVTITEDVNGLGSIMADLYDTMVESYCDPQVRRGITLTEIHNW